MAGRCHRRRNKPVSHVPFTMCCCVVFAVTVNFVFRIVRSFEAIARGLLQQENFTNITVIREDIAFIGELVS